MNPVGILSFTTVVPGNTSIGVYDVSGRLVSVFPQQYFGAGQHSILFDGRSTAGAELGSGVYFYRIETSTERMTGRFVIAR
jgi:flagellar hook assembly protein FlgD